MLESNDLPLNKGELEKQIEGLQDEIKNLKDSLPNVSGSGEHKRLKDAIKDKEKTLTDLQSQLLELKDKIQTLRRSERPRNPTEKMLASQEEEAKKRERRFNRVYDQWKIQARNTRQKLKTDIAGSELEPLVVKLEKEKENVMCIYAEIRNHTSPSTEVRRRTDACEAVTKDIVKIMNERITDVDGDLDAHQAKERLHELLYHDYSRSIYGSTISSISCTSSASRLAAKRVDAAAELAFKKAEYELRQEEEKQRKVIQNLEDQQRRELEEQKAKLENLKAEKELRAAQARFNIYNQEAAREACFQSVTDGVQRENLSPPAVYQPSPTALSSYMDMSQLTQAFQESISLNRLPMPEPSVFNGDPIHFIEWRASFVSLIDQKGITSAEKLFYLKRYVGGQARKSLEGFFYRNDDEAYKQAWRKLNHRYGQPFVIQRAFRERLAKWPKIHPREAEGLRDFSDFLNACQEAMPQVKGLQILNDCEENQRLVQKLPDWVASRWNRKVTEALHSNEDFPSFHDFANFMSMEAEIACNPITSFNALHPSEPAVNKRSYKDVNRDRANVLSTQVAADNESKEINKVYTRPPCFFCHDSRHQLHACSKFMSKSLNERKTFAKEKGLCYGCMKPGHNKRDCRYPHSCDSCKGKHPTCLHDNDFLNKTNSALSPKFAQEEITETTTALSLNVARDGLSANTSMIVPVWVSSKENTSLERLVYALLDTQSDTTFIDEVVSDALQADKCPVKLKLTTMITSETALNSERVSGLRIRGYSSATHIDLPPVYTKNCIPVNRDHIPTSETAKQWNHLLVIANEIPPLQDCEIGLLIGYDCSRALAPRQVITGGDNEPYAVRTDLGWSIVGGTSLHLESPNLSSLCHRVTVKELPLITPADAIRALETDFKDSTEDDKPAVSQDDILFLNKLNDGIRKNHHGHYEMPLPFKKRPLFPDNKQLAMVRLNHLKRKMMRDESYKKHYIEFMKEVIDKGDAERVEEDAKAGEKWYIPHHGVYHAKKPTKLRVVFDASAKYKGTSLNDHLLQGPDLTNNLTGVLLRFRLHPVALMCDIEKMFHQFHVHEADRNYLRFLWWENGDFSIPPQEFRMNVHLFGAASSPGCASYGLKYLAEQNEQQYPLGSKFIMTNFYVDDGVTSLECNEEAIQLAQEAQEICAVGGLRLHKFISNDKSVLESIPPSERANDIQNLDLAFDDLPVERALGIQWNIANDCFSFSTNLKEQPATRRGILSTVASLYDPLGFVAPFLLNGKRVLQEMCRHGSGWDDPLSEVLRPRWENWKDDLKNLEKVTISRCYAPSEFGKVIKRELHHFSDASTTGYGQCSYLRMKNEQENVYCSLVLGKSRVAPTKVTTIPRLELTAAVVSVKVGNILKDELGLSGAEEFFWTDSKVVLGYINNEVRRFHTFVANRVQKIHLGSKPQQWRYVPTNENPADYASRGLTVNELLSSSWFTGPKFLWEREIFPFAEVVPELPLGDPEVRKVQVLNTKTTEQVSLVDRLSNHSSWSCATRAVARILRRVKGDKSNNQTTVLERERAECVIIKDLQEEVYREELQVLRKRTQLSPRSKLYNLDPFLDQNGLLRVGGRLKDSTLPSIVKHPAIIPKGHHITKMLMAHFHGRVKHQGKGLTINEIRANGFWIPGINRAVASYIHQCVICRKLRRPSEEQRMADLPVERVDPSPPFTYCGIDCFGPFLVKQGRKVVKRYGLILTCFCSRAIHIEMLDDMSTDAFINGLRCFIAIRGAVRQITCDQGSNFVGAKNEMKKALKELDEERLAAFLATKQCDFSFISPHSSHVGGAWERQIRTVRSVLSSSMSLSPGRLDDASLRTFFYEVMAIVNSRPLTVENLNDPQSLEPLTPNHLLTIKSVAALPPPGKFVKEDMYARKRWRHIQYLAEQFWSRWRKEYLTNIALRQRWHTPKRNLHIGDIVMEMDDGLPRNEWRLGRVAETTVDKDGLVRKVKLCLGDRKLGKRGERLHKQSNVVRPVQKLVLLLENN